MKRMFAVVVLGLGVIVTLPLSAGGKDTGVEKAITAMEYSWAGAQRGGKGDVAEPMLAESFTNTDADGHTGDWQQVIVLPVQSGKDDLGPGGQCPERHQSPF